MASFNVGDDLVTLPETVKELITIAKLHQSVLEDHDETISLRGDILDNIIDRIEDLERRQEYILKEVVKTSKNRLNEVHRLREELDKYKSFMPKDDTVLHHSDITHDGVWRN